MPSDLAEPVGRVHARHPASRPGPRCAAALSGLLAVVVALGVAELCAAFVGPTSSPVIAVGGAFIDIVPSPLKEFAIRTFGTYDKIALLAGIYVTVFFVALALGVLAYRRLVVGLAGLGAFAVIGAAVSLSRPGGGLLDALPSVAGAGAAAVALTLLVGVLRGAPGSAGSAVAADGQNARQGADQGSGFDRRGFILAGAGSAAVAMLTGAGGYVLGRSRSATAASRAAVALPAPAGPAPPLPAGVDLRVPGMTPFVTPIRDFYRVDTALVVPQLSAADWTLNIHGMVDRPRTITFKELLGRPLIERHITLTCVSNEVGGPYVGHTRWLGAPLADLLREAGIRPGADQIVSRSSDGWTCGTPTAVVMDGRDAMLAVAMDGQPLTAEHGFPVRMVVPGLYGYVSACKWIVDIELTRFADFDAYWVRRGWAAKAPIKTASRIDTPRPFAKLQPGRVAIAGVAFAQHRGIRRVEVRVDDGPWQEARLADEASIDSWRQWIYEWDAAPGTHRIQVRATDATAAVQTEQRVPPIPDGATGWHSVVVTVG